MPLFQQWGRKLEITRDAAGGFQPLGEPGNLDLLSLYGPPGRPVIWILDLEIVDVATGQPPVWPDPLNPPTTPEWAGAFSVSFGAGGDSREHVFPPGIHCVIAQAVRVRAIPQIPSGVPSRFRFAVHATWTLAVPPSYSWIR